MNVYKMIKSKGLSRFTQNFNITVTYTRNN